MRRVMWMRRVSLYDSFEIFLLMLLYNTDMRIYKRNWDKNDSESHC